MINGKEKTAENNSLKGLVHPKKNVYLCTRFVGWTTYFWQSYSSKLII